MKLSQVLTHLMKQIPSRINLIWSMLTFKNYLAITIDRKGIKARSAIWGKNPLVPLYILSQLEALSGDIQEYMRESIPKTHMFTNIAEIDNDKRRKELRTLLDRVYKGK